MDLIETWKMAIQDIDENARKMPDQLRDLAGMHPCLHFIARGRGSIRWLFNDPSVGYYGQCYDFAAALKRVLGTGEYVALRDREPGGTAIYHVLLLVNGWLLDASGMQPWNDAETSRHQHSKFHGTLSVVKSAEIEYCVDPGIMNEMIAVLHSARPVDLFEL